MRVYNQPFSHYLLNAQTDHALHRTRRGTASRADYELLLFSYEAFLIAQDKNIPLDLLLQLLNNTENDDQRFTASFFRTNPNIPLDYCLKFLGHPEYEKTLVMRTDLPQDLINHFVANKKHKEIALNPSLNFYQFESLMNLPHPDWKEYCFNNESIPTELMWKGLRGAQTDALTALIRNESTPLNLVESILKYQQNGTFLELAAKRNNLSSTLLTRILESDYSRNALAESDYLTHDLADYLTSFKNNMKLLSKLAGNQNTPKESLQKNIELRNKADPEDHDPYIDSLDEKIVLNANMTEEMLRPYFTAKGPVKAGAITHPNVKSDLQQIYRLLKL
jgi:hypothetical protein